MTAARFVLWESRESAPIVVRVAIAGDFLPAGCLSLPDGGWSDAARRIADVLDDIDVTFLNLESPLDAAGLPIRPVAGIGQSLSAESASLDYLKSIRSAAVGIANNHTYDFGRAGVDRTRAALASRNFTPLGAGHTLRDSPEVFVWGSTGSVRVGFWAAARASRDLATRRTPGVEPATLSRARIALSVLESLGATFSVALLHCGCLRTNRPDPSDLKLLDSIASTGFNLVAASHSHRVSGSKVISRIAGAPSFCFYGLGSVASGYVASPLEREGIVVVVGFHIDGSMASIEVRPVWLADSGFAEMPNPKNSCAIISRFQSLGQEISDGSYARRFYDDVSLGALPLYTRDLRAALRQSGVLGLAQKVRRVRVRHLRRLLHGVIP